MNDTQKPLPPYEQRGEACPHCGKRRRYLSPLVVGTVPQELYEKGRLFSAVLQNGRVTLFLEWDDSEAVMEAEA